jgi:hypothetical protein
MSSFQLPTFPDLQDAPHLATLALLDAALAVVQDALCIQHPIDDPLRAPDPGDPHSLIAARLIVTRCLELRRLLAWYRRALERDDDLGF